MKYTFSFLEPNAKVYVISKKADPNRALIGRAIKSIPLKLAPSSENQNAILSFSNIILCKETCKELEENDDCEIVEVSIEDVKKSCDILSLPMVTFLQKCDDDDEVCDIFYYKTRPN
jgi:hypothetical protein